VHKQTPSILSSTIAFPGVFNRKNRKTETTMAENTASTVAVSATNEDKHPFMAMDDAPMCPACNVPMILSSEKRLLRKSKQVYICPNAPDCPETYEVEE
jgi:enterochelin esterase-like enzyme